MSSEFSFINQIRKKAAKGTPDFIVGIGDDAAILSEREGRERLITSDLLIEDVHFKLEYMSLHCLGHKALAVSLSDIAAMGGTPEFALLSLGLPSAQFANLNWQDFFEGYFSLAEKHNVALIGGDTSASPEKLVIDSIVLGSCARNKAVRRSGAKVGDAIYVIGSLGASAVGLELLQQGERLNEKKNDQKQTAIRAHLMPEPRIEVGQKLSAFAHSMMDISDGLAQDLSHICEESQVNAVIEFAAVPVADCVALVATSREAAFSLAVSGGEDYELLLTASRENEAELMKLAKESNVPLTKIGEIVARERGQREPAVYLHRDGQVELLSSKGYDHFRKSNFAN